MSRLLGLLVLSLAMVACQQQPAVVDSTVAIPTVTTVASVAESTTTASTITDTDDDENNGCFDAEPPLVGDGFLGRFEAQDSDSEALSGFNWSETGDCAAVTLSFRTEAGAPAVDPPEFRAEYLRHTAVVRLELGPEVVDAAVSDQALDTNLLTTAYVAYEPAAAALVVDIHLATGSEVRVRPASSPARIILELEADGRPVAGSAMAGEAVIVFAPASSTPPLVVQGYGRSGIEISASFVSSTQAIEDTISFEPSPTRWTTFDWTIRDFQPGPIVIRVGDAAPIEFISR
jgi:hypothetical protein